MLLGISAINIKSQEAKKESLAYGCNGFELSQQDFNLFTTDLKNIISKNIKNTHKRHLFSSSYPFDGSYDFHSSIHAHWALLSLARISNDQVLWSEMYARLPIENLENMVKNFILAKDVARDTHQYAKFWFLLLLAELDKHDKYLEKQNINNLRIQLENHLVDWLQNPYLSSYWHKATSIYYPNGIYKRGDHFSWPLLFWLMLKSKPVSDYAINILKSLEEKWKSHIKNIMNDYHPNKLDFVNMPSIVYLIDSEIVKNAQQPLLIDFQRPNFGKKKFKRLNSHLIGQQITYDWAIANSISRGNNELCKEYYGNLRALNKKDFWKEDFKFTSHWIPQFIWFGLMIATKNFKNFTTKCHD